MIMFDDLVYRQNVPTMMQYRMNYGHRFPSFLLFIIVVLIAIAVYYCYKEYKKFRKDINEIKENVAKIKECTCNKKCSAENNLCSENKETKE